MYAIASNTSVYEDSAETSVFQNNVQILRNGHLVSRASDYIIYSVEAASIGKVVAQFGPCVFLSVSARKLCFSQVM